MPIRFPKTTYKGWVEGFRDIGDILKSMLTDDAQPYRWDDLNAILLPQPPGTTGPDWTQVKTDGSGSTGVYLPLFDATTEQSLFYLVQLPHTWQETTEIEPHVHWVATDANSGNVVWGLEYTRADVGDAFGNTTLVTVTDAASGVAYEHQVASFSNISPSDHHISHVWICRVYRDADNGSDTYASDAGLAFFDLHLKRDTDRGSKTPWSKWG